MALIPVDSPPPTAPLSPRWRGILALSVLVVAMLFFLQLLDRGLGIGSSLKITGGFVGGWLICAGLGHMTRVLKRALGRL